MFGCPAGTVIARSGVVLNTPRTSLRLLVKGAALCVAATLGASVLTAPPAAASPPGPPSAGKRKPKARSDTFRESKYQRQRKKAAYAVRYAYKQIGDRYRYGGTGPVTWDCSGLAGGSWRKAGVNLPRITTSIYAAVRVKVSYRSMRPGDLIFFYGGRSHMGIYVGKGYMIHAPSTGKRVQKVKLSGYYKRQFHGAVRPGI